MEQKNSNNSKYLGSNVHIVTGLSKDFGLAGFRIGWLFTHNSSLLKEVGSLGHF